MTEYQQTSDTLNPTKHVGGLLIVAVLAVTALGLTSGRMVAEKVVSDMAMPCGVTWLAMTMVGYFALVMRQRFLFLISFFAWLLFTLGSNTLVANHLIEALEKDYLNMRPLSINEPYDMIVVLGGGTGEAANGESQLGPSGDRIGLAARMYHAGRTQTIVCTGSKIAGLSRADDLDAGEQSRVILKGLGVPDKAIETLGGRNTSEEIQELTVFLANRTGLRVGLLTSAWHLPRAMRLARAASLEVEPVPADFKTSRQKLTARSFVPNASALYNTHLALQEYLAELVGR